MEEEPSWVTLTEDEEILWHDRPTIYPYIRKLITPLILIGIGIGLYLYGSQVEIGGASVPSSVPIGIIGGLIVVFGFYNGITTLVRWWSIRFLITSDEIYKKQGALSRSVQNLQLNQIQNTRFIQTFLGRLLSHGHVFIETAGSRGTDMIFQNVNDPESVVGMITEQLDKLDSQE